MKWLARYSTPSEAEGETVTFHMPGGSQNLFNNRLVDAALQKSARRLTSFERLNNIHNG